jgi:hypothetical protein
MTSSSLFLTAFASLLVLASAPGCAADADANASEQADEGEIETDEAALAAMSYYDCRGGEPGIDTLARIEIGLSTTRLAVTDLSKDAAVPDIGKLDRSYRPGPTYTGAIRFASLSKLEDSFSSDVAHVEIIVSKELKAKAAQGKMWIRTSGSGGDSDSYWCKSKPKKLSVDASRKARLACSFSPIICTNDNPPGDTCLADLFVNQTSADGATLKLMYLDHFGVRATPRSQQVGASSALARTTKKIDASWGDNELKLTHRGGVTYVGTFELPDGRSSKVQCNDLAMFD